VRIPAQKSVVLAKSKELLSDTVQKIISRQETTIDPLGAMVGIISALMMLGVYFHNKSLAKKAHSKALDAAAKDTANIAANTAAAK